MYLLNFKFHIYNSNSCFNPFIYVFMGTKFRQYFVDEFYNLKNSITCKNKISKSTESIVLYQKKKQSNLKFSNHINFNQIKKSDIYSDCLYNEIE